MPAGRDRVWLLGLVGLLAGLAVVVRALGFEYVFVDGGVVFPPADPQYHLRRALHAWSGFPTVLLFDPYINYPDGASVPWPPLFDLTIAGAARLLANDLHGFEQVAAWTSPALSALALLPVALVAARLVGSAGAVVAALFLALLPIAATYGRVGNADHHAAVATIGAWLLWVCVALVDRAGSGARLHRLAAAHALIRVTLLLTWHGSLLYLAVSEALLLGAAIALRSRELLAAQAAGAAASAAVLVPILALSPTPLGGDYSSIALSRLHVIAMLGVAVVALGLWIARGRRPDLGPWALFGLAAAIGLLAGAVLLILPGPRAGLVPALRFLTLRDEVGAVTGEQSPIFALAGRAPGRPAASVWGGFAYLIPLAPLAVALSPRARREDPGGLAAAVLLGTWGALFAGLALLQRRYGNDFAPAAAVLFALALCWLARRALAWRGGPAPSPLATGALASLLCVVLYWPAIRDVHLPRARGSLAALRAEAPGEPRTRATVAATLSRFMSDVRRTTPPTSGYLDDAAWPEYGVIAHANLGHALQYGARRATATDPFWWYIGRENWDRSFAFLEAMEEPDALRLAEALRGRFVVTMNGMRAGGVVERLHRADGAAEGGRPPLAHFRLVTEAPPGAPAVGDIFEATSRSAPPYKLFEIVEAAVLEVAAAPGLPVLARTTVRTPSQRRFDYEVRTETDASGLARLRLPYATPQPDARARHRAAPLGAWRIRVGDVERRLRVPEAAVREGQVLRLSLR